MTTKQLAEMETLFKALADTTRLRILGLLLAGEICVCDIHESLKLPQPKTSRHLAYLRRTGLVETRRDGLWIHYRLGRLADPILATIADAVHDALAHTGTVRRDAQRLQKRTGCCLPVGDGAMPVATPAASGSARRPARQGRSETAAP